MTEINETLVTKLSDLFEADIAEFVETVMVEHYVAKAGIRAGRMVHADCHICDWLDEHLDLTQSAVVNRSAEEAYGRLIERCLHEPTEDHITLRVKNSWVGLYEFVRGIARDGIFENLNSLSRNLAVSHAGLSLLRDIENKLQQNAVNVMLVSEGKDPDDDEV